MGKPGISNAKSDSLKDLRRIPGVGAVLSEALYSIGIHSVAELKSKEPERLYMEYCRKKGKTVDRCVLYVFRLAVYFATEKVHDKRLLKWWVWKVPPRRC